MVHNAQFWLMIVHEKNLTSVEKMVHMWRAYKSCQECFKWFS